MITAICIIAFLLVFGYLIGSATVAIAGKEPIDRFVCGCGAALNFALLLYILCVLARSNF